MYQKSNTSDTFDTSTDEVYSKMSTILPHNQQKSYSQVTTNNSLGGSQGGVTNQKISNLPKCIQLILGDNFKLYQIEADGACFMRTITLAVFQTEDPKDLAHFINTTMWDDHDLFFSDYNRTYSTKLIYGTRKVFVAKVYL